MISSAIESVTTSGVLSRSVTRETGTVTPLMYVPTTITTLSSLMIASA